MRHLKYMGWLWLLLGGSWSLIVALALLTSAPAITPYNVSRLAWWEEVIGDSLEGAIFLGSALCGIALLRHWRWSRLAVWVLGSIWFAFSVLMILSASGTLTLRVLWFGPSLIITFYSFVVLSLVRHERKPV